MKNDVNDLDATNGRAAQLPGHWKWATISQLGPSMKNGIYKPSEFYTEDGIACLRMYNIENGQIVWKDIKRMRLTDNELETYRLEPGDLLVNRVNCRELVGKAALIPEGLEVCVYESKNIRVRFPPNSVNSRYVAFWFLKNAQSYFNNNAQQTVGMASINQEQISDMPIPLAPLAEQKRIVDVIEAQFTRLDAAVAGLRRLRANLQRYRQSVLKAACEGRLVPTEAELARAEDRPFEDGATLLQRVLAERRRQWEADNRPQQPKDDKWKAKYREPAAPDVSSLPDLPDGWSWATVEQLTSRITSGSRGWAEYYSSQGATFIRAQDINTDRLILDNVAYVTLPSSASAEARRTRVFESDLLITITGANVTKTARVIHLPDEAYVNQHVAIVRPVCSQITPYIYCWIVSPTHGRAALEKDAYGAGKPGLNLTNISEVNVALPPLAEQQRIVEEVERRLSVIEQHEQVIAASLKRAERLRQSILKRAFAGQL